MKKGKTFKISVRKTVMQASGGKVITALSSGAPITDTLVVGDDPVTRRLTVYLNTEEKSNAAGMVEAITDDKGAAQTADILRDILSLGYECKALELGEEANTFICEFVELLPDNKNAGATATSDEVQKAMDSVVDMGYCSKAEIEDRIKVFHDLRVPDKLIIDILTKKYHKHKYPVKRPNTIWVDAYPKDSPIMVKAFINVMIGRSQIFEGPKSVGKNVAMETLAWLLNKPVFMNTYNRYMTGDDIWGQKSTVPPEINDYSEEELAKMALCELRANNGIDNDDETLELAAKFKALSAKAAAVQIAQEKAQLTEAILDDGVYIANEMNLAETNFLSGIMNQLTDNTGFVAVPGMGRVNLPEGFTVWGTQNNGYAGTNEQNAATMSRFATITFAFPGSVKGQLKAAVGEGLDNKYYTQVDNLYKELLTAVKQGVVQDDCLNIRGFVSALKAVKMYPDYTKLAEQINIQVISSCPQQDKANLIAQVNDKISL